MLTELAFYEPLPQSPVASQIDINCLDLACAFVAVEQTHQLTHLPLPAGLLNASTRLFTRA